MRRPIRCPRCTHIHHIEMFDAVDLWIQLSKRYPTLLLSDVATEMFHLERENAERARRGSYY